MENSQVQQSLEISQMAQQKGYVAEKSRIEAALSHTEQ